ncbi:hypothetical protein [Gordonia neofelifaecis]|uniref:Uncharacterized protein n=1 Tax=Gordonia neofelifaecis NRRL B-59395 TaxID=644548 RepID=F1YFF1_9ACTN|nr:hypothetical protein [Gordonia neofelifaecis]EGD56439.1 hypothetical protein SCNU_02762 [Gordonia neofelifaecis NRRL B-59395]
MTTPTTLSRLRGAVVGGTSAVTGVAAHAAAQGMLPDTSVLVLVAATAVVLGLGATAAPGLGALPALIVGQGLVHLLLVVTSGHHHDMLTAPMAATHAAGTVAALLFLCGAEILVRAASAFAIRAIAPAFAPRAPELAAVVVRTRVVVPASLLFLGAVGRRGPPLSV